MRRPLLCALSALALGLSVLAVPGASPSTSAQRAASSLTISPQVFVGGQSLTFEGTLSGASNARLKIETLFNRAGDSWITRDGNVGTTDAQGNFRFSFPGPNNYNIRYRVKAVGGSASPAVLLQPRQQEVVLSLNGGAEQAPGSVVTGEVFTIDVDTTPSGRGIMGLPAPPFQGRLITLQQRVDVDRWATVDTTVTAGDGSARFLRTALEPGPRAFRVVKADIAAAGDRIGWFPSYPLLVDVLPPGATPPRTPSGTGTSRPQPVAPNTSGHGTATATASQRYKWGPSAFDFAWEEGESLTDQPYRGTRRKGAWRDASDGSGRVAHYNGGMAITSNITEFPAGADHGDVSATLTGNALTYGRWEFRRRIDLFKTPGHDYRIKIDLVPAQAKHARCGSNTINVADVGYDSTTATIGVSSARAGRSWTGTRKIPRLGDRPHSFGVEVTRKHVSWFLDGNTLATVKNRKVAPGVPLTPRLSIVGRGTQQMQRTRVLYDWQRGWPLNKQALKARTGPGLKAKALSGRC